MIDEQTLTPKKSKPKPERRLLSTTQAAEYLCVSGATIRRLIYAGELPVIRTFKHYRVDVRDLDDFIAKHKDVL
jgi:excisionase family DNA binding protein